MTSAPPPTSAGQPPGQGVTMPMVAVLAGAMLLTLLGFQLALQLPGGQNIEDVLGWTRYESVQAALELWRGPVQDSQLAQLTPRWHMESAYLLVDTWLFMPLYAVLLLLLARSLQSRVLQGGSPQGRSMLGSFIADHALTVTGVAVAALLVADAMENYGGASRVGLSLGLFAACLVAGLALGVALWLVVTHDGAATRRTAARVIWASFIVGAGLVAAGVFGQLGASGCRLVRDQAGLLVPCLTWSATAHEVKLWFAVAAFGWVGIAWLLWLYGADRKPDHREVGLLNERRRRALLRSEIGAIVWRTRYVLLVLALFAGLTLGLDQCRDVLLALAYVPPQDASAAERALAPSLWLRLFVVLMVGISVALLVYSTWLWARLACRIRRQRDVLKDLEVQADVDERLKTVDEQLGSFARAWARLLSLVPLMCIYALVAFSISDAINASNAMSTGGSAPDELRWTVALLACIGLIAVGAGALFLMVRRVLSLKNEAHYFNHAEGLYELLLGKDEDDQPPLPPAKATLAGRLRLAFWRLVRWLHGVTPWLNPRTLPLMALGLLLLLRAMMALSPEAMSATPAALAVVALTLTWWMGVAGALTLAEVRQGRPYGLFVIAALGLVTLLPLGIGHNHVLPLALPLAGQEMLATLRLHGLLLVGLLSVMAGALWWLFSSDIGAGSKPDRRAAAVRWTGVLLFVLLALIALRWADRASLPAPSAEESAHQRAEPATVPTLDQAVQAWEQQLPPGGGKVFLVASEGGGIRSAYWTALALAELRAHYPQFDQRTFAMSGVSGGAVGIAAYSACLRKPKVRAGAESLGGCVVSAFGAIDPLSPLLASGLFEDALARLLPVPMASDGQRSWWRCGQPACGHLSRALGFEREWMRALPPLAQPLSAAGQTAGGWEPHLLLNSTWVETGELAPAASLVVDHRQFPGARDVQRRLGRELTLIGGAHAAARFPFVNPLAAVQPASGAAQSTARAASAVGLPEDGDLDGHLADGGYFDNSAALALAPVWRSVHARLQMLDRGHELVVVVIRNGQKAAVCDRPDPAGPLPVCIRPERRALTDPSQLAQPSQRSNWALYADMLGPLVTVLNVSGIGAHGRRAPAALQAEAEAMVRSATSAASAASMAPTAVLMPVDQLDKGALVPLGWYLSPTARRALQVQAGCLAAELRGKPGPGCN